MPEPIDRTTLPVCPNCGMEMRDAWELDFRANEDVETDCGYCGRAIVVTQHLAVTYTTRRRD